MSLKERMGKGESAIPPKPKPKKSTLIKKKKPVVKGVRTCMKCKGICHEDSLREKHDYKHRKKYFCSESCFDNHYKQMYSKELKKHGLRDNESYFRSDTWKNILNDYKNDYELVDCITE